MSLDMMFGIGVIVTRVLQILVGTLLCVLGYRLFEKVQTTDGAAELALSQHLKFNLSKVGPGVFFALFGAAILVQGLMNPLQYGRESSAAPAGPVTESTRIAGQRQLTAPEGSVQTSEDLRRHMRFMNTLEDSRRNDLSIEQRVTFENDLREAKLALMGAAWDRGWGDYARFAAWARGVGQESPEGDPKAIWDAK
jgi:hypothetical protein